MTPPRASEMGSSPPPPCPQVPQVPPAGAGGCPPCAHLCRARHRGGHPQSSAAAPPPPCQGLARCPPACPCPPASLPAPGASHFATSAPPSPGTPWHSHHPHPPPHRHPNVPARGGTWGSGASGLGAHGDTGGHCPPPQCLMVGELGGGVLPPLHCVPHPHVNTEIFILI